MRGILADINAEGHFQELLHVLQAATWREYWESLHLPVYTFADLGLPSRTPDVTVWELCQQQQLVLITANRNMKGPDSLEATIRARNTPSSLPVITFADQERILRGTAYTHRVAERLLEYLLDMDTYRGTGRLWVP